MINLAFRWHMQHPDKADYYEFAISLRGLQSPTKIIERLNSHNLIQVVVISGFRAEAMPCILKDKKMYISLL